jgi:hypothetical protein
MGNQFRSTNFHLTKGFQGICPFRKAWSLWILNVETTEGPAEYGIPLAAMV